MVKYIASIRHNDNKDSEVIYIEIDIVTLAVTLSNGEELVTDYMIRDVKDVFYFVYKYFDDWNTFEWMIPSKIIKNE
jgi:hypothetical protein